MTEWTYAHQYVRVGGKRPRESDVLAERGTSGWELVSAVPLGKRARRRAKGDVLLLFKRAGAASESAAAVPLEAALVEDAAPERGDGADMAQPVPNGRDRQATAST
jgi:hypothetical protein